MNDEIEIIKTKTPWKTIVAGTFMVFTCGGYCAITAIEFGKTQYIAWRDKFIEDGVVAYLQSHPIEIDARNPKKPLPPEVRREDLLKMVFITHSRMSQCESNLQIIKDTISYNEVK